MPSSRLKSRLSSRPMKSCNGWPSSKPRVRKFGWKPINEPRRNARCKASSRLFIRLNKIRYSVSSGSKRISETGSNNRKR